MCTLIFVLVTTVLALIDNEIKTGVLPTNIYIGMWLLNSASCSYVTTNSTVGGCSEGAAVVYFTLVTENLPLRGAICIHGFIPFTEYIVRQRVINTLAA